jgi:hypothetical protein
LRQGRSIRRSAAAIGVGAAALHRHWQRHVPNRDSVRAVNPISPRNETESAEPLEVSLAYAVRGRHLAGRRSAGARNAWDAWVTTRVSRKVRRFLFRWNGPFSPIVTAKPNIRPQAIPLDHRAHATLVGREAGEVAEEALEI